MRQFDDAAQVMAFLDGLRQRNQQVLDRYAEFTAQSGAVTGEGFSEDGTVRAAVGPDGAVQAVDIPDAALRRGTHLAQMIMAAIREAQADRALKLTALGERLGTGRVRSMVEDAIPQHTRDRLEERRG
ncbi:YbaB/EbfC family nucleoid-associated protein [Catenuloplanes sp. NPDC051500]|uniref:YbaB/EbfC family nucleoid-associated protein n=1 Tax=Catenuloplanes sp. NPDC051500 TaxID=3363959 RepID=UPI003788B6D8